MGKRQKKDKTNSNRRPQENVSDHDDMYDEIDAFHKQRDVVPLDINADGGGSDEDYENPVFDLKGISDDDGDEDDEEITGFAARIVRQQKFLNEKFGGVEDDVHDEDDAKEEEGKLRWGRKDGYYGGDNREAELSSEDESAEEEEAEVNRMREEKIKYLSDEDFGLEYMSEGHTDRELTLEEISAEGKSVGDSFGSSHLAGDVGTTLEVKKDLNALSKQEQMDVVYSSAPELVDLLSELNNAREQLQDKVIPLLQKAKEGLVRESVLRYLEVRQVLLLAYCQAISCYLLLKSEGRPVRDHPVLARILEIQGLLDKMNKLDGNLQLLDEIKENGHQVETRKKSEEMNIAKKPIFVSKDSSQSAVDLQVTEPQNTSTLIKVTVEPNVNQDNSGGKHKHENRVGMQSREMLKVRAALEDKLKQKGIIGSSALKTNRGQKRAQPLNGQLETYDDFDDDTLATEGGKRGPSNGESTLVDLTKISKLVRSNQKKPKVVTGDDDLPKRDDIGERRRKHELRVLAGAGIRSDEDDGTDEVGTVVENGGDYKEDGSEDSADEFYKQVEHQRAAKQAEKAKLHARTPAVTRELETVDGKRHITTQMEKNRGLTPSRKKAIKNPRKKYRTKHQKETVRRKGQVRDVRKPSGQYGGETTGINARISRSIRLK